MKIDTNALLSTLIFDVALPEITSVIRAHHAATGQFPTNEEVIAAMQADGAAVVDRGHAWLHEHGYDGLLATTAASPAGSSVE